MLLTAEISNEAGNVTSGESSNYFISLFNNWWQIITIVAVVILVVLFFTLIKSNMNEKSRERLNQNGNKEKYIKDVYIEVGDSAERLRFFSDKKMKKAATRQLNYLLRDYNGKAIAKKCNIFFWQKNTFFLERNIKRISKFLKSKIDDNELDYVRHNCSYFHSEQLKKLNELVSLYLKRIMVIKGNAGSGKTNLIYDFCKKLLGNNGSLIYSNCRYINESIEDYFYKSFFVGKNSFQKPKTIARWLFMLKQFIFRKKIFVVFEGVNEAERDGFDIELIDFLNDINRYFLNRRVFKFIISTREEHFSASFEETLKNLNDLNSLSYNNIQPINNYNSDFENIINKYKNHFNFKGDLSTTTKHIISKSFFMVRLFFELFKDQSDNVDIKNSREIFDKYISELSKNNKCVYGILNEICEIMTSNKTFDGVTYDSIIKKGFTKKDIDYLVMNSTLICKTIRINQSSNLSISNEYITILFDEFRDFLIANHINQKRATISILKDLIDNKFTCEEGVTKYLYLSYRLDNKLNKCKEIISIPEVSRIFVNRRERVNIVTSVIIDCELKPLDFELEYINKLYYGEDSYLLFDLFLDKLSDDDSVVKKIINFIRLGHGSFETGLKKFHPADFEKKIINQINRGYSNDEVINNLNIILNYIKNEYEEREKYFVLDELNYKYRFDYLFVPIFKNKIINKESFVEKFKVAKGSYYYEKICSIHEYFFGCYWDPYIEYRRHYKYYFENFDEFLISHYHIPMKMINYFRKDDLRIKYSFSSSSDSIAALIRIESIKNILKEVIDTHYEN